MDKQITLQDQQFFVVWFLNKILFNFQLELTQLGLITESVYECDSNIILAEDFETAFTFIDLSYTVFTKLKKQEDLYKELVNNKYFNSDLFLNNLKEIKNNTTGFKRLYIGFKNYINNNKCESKYYFSNYEDVYIDVIDYHFDIFSNKQFVSFEEHLIANSTKFNGTLVTEWTGILPSETLGFVINGFKQNYGFYFEKYLLKSSKDEIKSDFLKYIKNNLVS